MDLISPKPDLLVVFTDAIKCKVGREFLAYMSKRLINSIIHDFPSQLFYMNQC